MSDFAAAINAEMNRHSEELRDYGRLLAQAGFDLPGELSHDDLAFVNAGYAEQLHDYPEG